MITRPNFVRIALKARSLYRIANGWPSSGHQSDPSSLYELLRAAACAFTAVSRDVQPLRIIGLNAAVRADPAGRSTVHAYLPKPFPL